MTSTSRPNSKSIVWQYFNKLSDREVHCNICSTKLAFHGGTTARRSHLSVKPKDGELWSESAKKKIKLATSSSKELEGGKEELLGSSTITQKGQQLLTGFNFPTGTSWSQGTS